MLCPLLRLARKRYNACRYLAHSSAGSTFSGDTKLKDLIEHLKQVELDAFVIPTGDPHLGVLCIKTQHVLTASATDYGSQFLGEYCAPKFERRQFITGFTGSAGTALVLQSGEAFLWTDGRYFQQADMELTNSWKLMKSGDKVRTSFVH